LRSGSAPPPHKHRSLGHGVQRGGGGSWLRSASAQTQEPGTRRAERAAKLAAPVDGEADTKAVDHSVSESIGPTGACGAFSRRFLLTHYTSNFLEFETQGYVSSIFSSTMCRLIQSFHRRRMITTKVPSNGADKN